MRESANVQTTCFEKRFIASKNRDKIDELKQILHRLHCDYIKILSVDSIPIPDVEKTGLTVSEKAKSKAESAKHFVDNKRAVLADDSGLCMATLEGAPGINSARYAKERDLNAAMDKIIANLSNQKIQNKHAHFVCTFHLIVLNGESYTFEGQINGTITQTKLGQGFGYDPIFVPNVYNKTFGEMGQEEKNKNSHRGIALKNSPTGYGVTLQTNVNFFLRRILLEKTSKTNIVQCESSYFRFQNSKFENQI